MPTCHRLLTRAAAPPLPALLTALLAPTIACANRKGEAEPVAATWNLDADGDGWGDASWPHVAESAPVGFVGTSGDCDDADSAVHPGATETCDGTDEDCDDEVDEDAADATTWFADADGDGFGDDDGGEATCTRPWRAVATGGDCDDADPAVHPGAAETCDDVDEDCDGAIDADDPDDVLTFADEDGDGFGDPTTGTLQQTCDLAADRVAPGGDCDDQDAEIHPDASEVCGNGVDADCSMDTTDCRWSGDQDLQAVSTVLPLDGPSDGSWLWLSAGLLDGDDHADLLAVADGVDIEGAGGALWWFSDVQGFAAGDTDAAVRVVGEEWGLGLSGPVSGQCGDLDGDELPDVLVSAYSWPDATSLVALLPLDKLEAGTLAENATVLLYGKDLDYSQHGIEIAGDLDGDGFHDAVVGVAGLDLEHGDEGGAWVLFGPLPATLALEDADALLAGVAPGDGAGSTVSAAGDADGDGLDDVVLAAPSACDGARLGGVVYMVHGPATGLASLAQAEGRVVGTEEEGFLAYDGALDAGGDVDGDGRRDLAIGGRGDHSAALIFLGPIEGALSPADAAFVVTDDDDESNFGGDIGISADLDGDGLDDLALSRSRAGTLDLFHAPLLGEAPISSADAHLSTVVATGYYQGVALAGPGDLDGDGVSELAVLAGGGGTGAEIYLVPGQGW